MKLKQFLNDSLQKIAASDPVGDLARNVVASGATEAEVAAILGSLRLPAPLKVDFQNALRDVKLGIRRKGLYSQF